MAKGDRVLAEALISELSFGIVSSRKEDRTMPKHPPRREQSPTGPAAGIAEVWEDAPAILHLDIDAFFASIEQLRDPRLRGRPVIVGAGVIASCSYEARRKGCKAGMPLTEARRLCPEAILLDGHAQIYRCFAERIFEIASRYAPSMETYLDEAYLDLTGTGRLHASFREAGIRLRAEIRRATGLAVSAGIGTNRMIAKMVTKTVKPDGFALLPPGEEDRFVLSRPIGDLPGVGRAVGPTLWKLNVRTVADLRELPEQALRGLFGRALGRALWERARGRDGRIVSEREVPSSIRRETSFHQPTIERRELIGMLHYLSTRAGREMRRLGLACRTVRVHLRYADGVSDARRSTFPSPTAVDQQIYGRAELLFLSLFTRRAAIRNVGVELSGFGPASGEQLDLLGGEERVRRCDLEHGLDRVRDRFGFAAVLGGPSLELVERLPRDAHGFVLRTPSLTK
ncbi:MAG: DNA polymerase IV [Candidatus Eisenbacteria bacterium]|nr:DNA polymerase IV [Candidatus Latescibacterota bacterium]MBD3301328.1 DNA polymerase IV [Candidatus Eisenbacteria bacterium]